MRSTNPAHTRLWVRDVVRSGLLGVEETRAEVRRVVAEDHPDLPTESTSDAWVEEARRDWYAEARTWPATTDYDRLQRAFGRLSVSGIAVLQGCADHWAAKERAARGDCRGVVWFTPPDVWHAIDQAMLEVNLWHADTANAAPGDELLDEVLGVLADAGLAAHFDEGRIEVTARWHRRPGSWDVPAGDPR